VLPKPSPAVRYVELVKRLRKAASQGADPRLRGQLAKALTKARTVREWLRLNQPDRLKQMCDRNGWILTSAGLPWQNVTI
jgi:hypothetical protein